jgi:hypothetical protein
MGGRAVARKRNAARMHKSPSVDECTVSLDRKCPTEAQSSARLRKFEVAAKLRQGAGVGPSR